MIKIKAIIELIRPLNILITMLVVFVSILIFSISSIDYFVLVLAVVSSGLVAASGNTINDYFDIEIDRINRPNRPLPSDKISLNEVLFYYLLFLISSITIALLLPTNSLVILISTLFLLFSYSYWFKGKPLIGNIVVSVCTALAFIFGGAVVGNIEASVMPAIFAFLITLIREILKDIEDIKGDRELNQRTFPVKFGVEKSKLLIVIVTIILITVTIIPFLTKLYKIEYLFVVLFFVDLPLVYITRNILFGDFINKLSFLSNVLKLIMIFGLIAIYVGIV